jgi:hypothetical protein
MHVIDIGDHALSEVFGMDGEDVDALKHLKDPPHGGILGWFAFLVRDSLDLFD